MVAFITQEFDKRLAMLRKGKSKVIEEDHILIVGFSERVIDIIREIVIANESDEGVIAILADMDKEEWMTIFATDHGFAVNQSHYSKRIDDQSTESSQRRD